GVPRLPAPAHRAAVWLEERMARVARRPPTVTAAAMRYLNREHAYSVSRAREVLGWEPRVDLDEGMRRTETWFREQGLLRAVAAWGEDAVPRCNGLFAFAALDSRRGRLLLARDRFGVKPLYLARHAGGLWFASEMRALIAAGVPARARPDVLAHSVAYG